MTSGVLLVRACTGPIDIRWIYCFYTHEARKSLLNPSCIPATPRDSDGAMGEEISTRVCLGGISPSVLFSFQNIPRWPLVVFKIPQETSRMNSFFIFFANTNDVTLHPTIGIRCWLQKRSPCSVLRGLLPMNLSALV